MTVDGKVVVVAVFQLVRGHAALGCRLAYKLAVGIIGECSIGFIKGEGKAVGAHLHAIKHLVYLHAVKQICQAAGAHINLHEAVGVSLRVLQRHANVLAQLTGYFIGARILHYVVYALQQAAEFVGCIVGVGA